MVRLFNRLISFDIMTHTADLMPITKETPTPEISICGVSSRSAVSPRRNHTPVLLTSLTPKTRSDLVNLVRSYYIVSTELRSSLSITIIFIGIASTE